MEDIRKFFEERDKFANYVGIEIVDISPGRAKVKMDIKKHHLNGLSIVHGAVLFTLADYAFAIASNSHGKAAVSINSTMSFLKAVSKGTIYAEAIELSKNPKLATYKVDVVHEEGELLAVFQGTVYRKKQSLAGILSKL